MVTAAAPGASTSTATPPSNATPRFRRPAALLDMRPAMGLAIDMEGLLRVVVVYETDRARFHVWFASGAHP